MGQADKNKIGILVSRRNMKVELELLFENSFKSFQNVHRPPHKLRLTSVPVQYIFLKILRLKNNLLRYADYCH